MAGKKPKAGTGKTGRKVAKPRSAKKASAPRAGKAAKSRAGSARAAKAAKAASAKSAASPRAAKRTPGPKPTRAASGATRRAAKSDRGTKGPSASSKPATASPPAARLGARELAHYRELLLAKRAQLRGDVATMHDAALRTDGGSSSTMPLHMADLGSDNYEQEFTLGLLENERALLREIDDALRRIEDRTYGICLATGKAIGKARLDATPWTKYCYEHVLEQERQRHGRY